MKKFETGTKIKYKNELNKEKMYIAQSREKNKKDNLRM
jgi:hypothetical protein